MSFKKLVISGGGSKGLILLGALHRFVESDKIKLEDVEEFAGTSIGSVLCLLIICGYTCTEILEHATFIDQNFFNSKQSQTIWEMMENFGALSMTKFMSYLEKLMIQKGWGKQPTLKEFYDRTHKTFIITGVNITKCQAEYYSTWTTPNLAVLDAVKISCNLPFIFKRIKYDNCLLIDGGLMNNLPIDQVDDKKSKILALNVTSFKPVETSQNLTNYFISLLSLPIIANTWLRIKDCGSNVEIVNLYPTQNDTDTNASFDFCINDDQKYNMFMKGYMQATHYRSAEYIYISFD